MSGNTAKISSPFSYGSTVSGRSFANREKELARLGSNFDAGINTMIISPRRWGKSSLVERAMGSYKRSDKRNAVVLLDLFSVNSQEEFLSLFAQQVIKAASSKLEDRLDASKRFFTRIQPKLTVSPDPGSEFSLSFDLEELKTHSSEILELPERIAAHKDIRFVICLDEFQHLAEIEGYEALEKKMRATWQRQKRVAYCLYGSKLHMMESIFNDPAKPFYRFGELILLDKIPREKWIRFLIRGFAKDDKEIDRNAASRMAEAMADHPWYVQQLAQYVWTMTAVGQIVKKKVIDAAIAQVVYTNAPLFEREMESKSRTQVELLKAIHQGEDQLGGKKVAKAYQVGTSRNVSKNKMILRKSDIIYLHDGKLDFMDPVFKRWFGHVYYDEAL